MATKYSPIWKDVFYETTDDTFTYFINLVADESTSESTIYEGKAYKAPNEDKIRININKICQNYLEPADINLLLTGDNESVTSYNCIKEFKIYKGGTNTALQTYVFVYDYDYGDGWNGTARDLGLPINNHYIDGMLKLYSTMDGGKRVVTYSNFSDYNKKVCKDWVLYYVNAQGGWSSFVIEGTVTRTDKITQYTTDKYYDNTSYDFGTDRYVAEISTEYTLNTHYLSDEESQKVAHNIIPSNRVYLHNVTEGRIIPVNITDTSVKYQTYRNNGKKKAQYQFKVKESQLKVRR